MLVLKRKKNEEIVVDNNVIFTIVDIRKDYVWVGIKAPREYSVQRKENVHFFDFESYLKSGEYSKAYELLTETDLVPTSVSASKLLNGLNESGQLTETIRDNLEKYIAK